MRAAQTIKYLFFVISMIIQSVEVNSSSDLLVSYIKENPPNAWDIPSFQLKGIDGKTHSLDEWKGKVILLNFWASWCPPCLAEIKDFIKFQKHFVNNNLQIISIGLDEEPKLKEISKKLNINYPVLFIDIEKPSGKNILMQWGNSKAYLPYSVIINTDGSIHYRHKGKLNTGLFDAYVRPLLDLNFAVNPASKI